MKIFSFAFMIAVAAACGDNYTVPVAQVDAPVAVETAVVGAGDFTSGHFGVLATVDVRGVAVVHNSAPQGAVGDDPVLRAAATELYVVNRADGNNVTILDATTRALITQLATGAGSNPQDVAVSGDKLYVPVYGGAGVAVLNRGQTTPVTLDLSVDDPDGHPECVSAAVVGDRLYVACELLDQNFAPRGNGRVYVVDTATDRVVQAITMQTPNPFGVFQVLPSGDLLIATINFATNGGCIEKITTGANPTSACVVDNATVGGVVSRIDVQPRTGGGTLLWLVVTSFDFAHGTLRSYDLEANMLSAPLSPATEIVGDLAVCPDGTIAIADQAKNASGVRLYRDGTETTTAVLTVGLPTKSANALVCY
jgi:hypothetical protein